MKCPSFRCLLFVWAALASTAAFAGTFHFSYTFGTDGTEVTGAFTGDRTGDFFENIQVLNLKVGGVALSGNFFVGSFADDYTPLSSGAYFGSDVSGNNFFFADADYANGEWPFTLFLHDYAIATPSGAFLDAPEAGALSFDFAPDAGRWAFWEGAATVPDATTSGGALLLTLLGLGSLSRRLRSRRR